MIRLPIGAGCWLVLHTCDGMYDSAEVEAPDGEREDTATWLGAILELANERGLIDWRRLGDLYAALPAERVHRTELQKANLTIGELQRQLRKARAEVERLKAEREVA